jgi:hypothetical protein
MESKLKVGDKVKLTAEGYHFHHNVDKMLNSYRHPSEWEEEAIENMLCEILAVQGIGIIMRFNEDGDPFVSWKWNNAGMFFKKRCYYDIDDVRKLNLWEKLCNLLS